MADDVTLKERLPVSAVGDALLALHRATVARDAVADRLLPPSIAELIKKPVPDIGDALFDLALGQMKQFNSLIKLGLAQLGPIAGIPFGAPPDLQLSPPIKDNQAAGSVKIVNRLKQPVIPRVINKGFSDQSGNVQEIATRFLFNPAKTEIQPGTSCALSMVAVVQPSQLPCFGELEVSAGPDLLARVFITLSQNSA